MIVDAFDSDHTTGDHTPVFLLLFSGQACVLGQMNSKQAKKKPTGVRPVSLSSQLVIHTSSGLSLGR